MRGCVFLASVVTALAALTTSGCHVGLLMVAAGGALDQGPYHAETLAKELGPTSVRTMGCLDIGLVVYERDAINLLDVHVGNRCGHPEALDFQRVVIRAVDEQGESRSVTIYDPRKEIVRMHVGGAERGKERLKLEDAHRLTRLCFDLEAIAPDAPASRPAPVCFEGRDGWKPVADGAGGLT